MKDVDGKMLVDGIVLKTAKIWTAILFSIEDRMIEARSRYLPSKKSSSSKVLCSEKSVENTAIIDREYLIIENAKRIKGE